MPINNNFAKLGRQVPSERDSKLNEYNALKEKAKHQTQFSEADQKRLNALEKELQERNIINQSGQTSNESLSIFDKVKPELSMSEYNAMEARKEKIQNFLKGFFSKPEE